jgi:hypothetical protein
MKFILLIYQDERQFNAISDAERQKLYVEYGQLREELQAKGQFLAGSQLQPTGTAASVRLRSNKELVTDGPFAETHEQLGGYFLIEAASRNEAVAIAKRIPSARTGTIEVRPLVERMAQTSP